MGKAKPHPRPSTAHTYHSSKTVVIQDSPSGSSSDSDKATVYLHIADFRFSDTFIICDKLPDIDILLGIGIQKRYSLSHSWDSDKQLFIQRIRLIFDLHQKL